MIKMEEVDTKECGRIKVFFQGSRTSKDVILTVHDLGCDHTEMADFVSHESMQQLLNHCTWAHVEIPGQGSGECDLPQNYGFPSMQQLAEAIGEICDALKFKHVVVLGDGAGANILARFAIARRDLVLGAVLINFIGAAASVTESLREKVMSWKLNSSGMNPTAESNLILHRFGAVDEQCEDADIAQAVKEFRKFLHESINPRNLAKFVTAYTSRSKIGDRLNELSCPILFVTGTLALHSRTVFRQFTNVKNSARNQPQKMKHIELLQLDDVANVLRGRPEKVAYSLQYFIQGLGLAGAAVNRRMSTTLPQIPARGRSMSMEQYDQPKGVSSCVFDKHRKYSTAVAEADDEVAA